MCYKCIRGDVECARPGKRDEWRRSLLAEREALRIEFLPIIQNNYSDGARDVAVRENTDMTHVSEVATLLRKIAEYSRLPLAKAKKRAADDYSSRYTRSCGQVQLTENVRIRRNDYGR